MAIYRFKVSFEDYDDIERDIDIKSNQTFEDLHRAIHQSTGYNADLSSSFYVSSDQWIKKEEIAKDQKQEEIVLKQVEVVPKKEEIKTPYGLKEISNDEF